MRLPQRLSACVGATAVLAGLAVAAASAQAPGSRRLAFPGNSPSGLPGSFWADALELKGGAARRERLIVVTSAGQILETIDGSRENVLLSGGMADALAAGRLGVTLVHNHTAAVGLSGDDLYQLAKPGVERVIAVAADGTVYEATLRTTRTMLDSAFFDAAMNRVEARLKSEAGRDAIPLGSVYPHLPHLVTLVLQRAGLVDYRVTPGVAARLEFIRYRSLFDRVVDLEGLTLQRNLGLASRTGK